MTKSRDKALELFLSGNGLFYLIGDRAQAMVRRVIAWWV